MKAVPLIASPETLGAADFAVFCDLVRQGGEVQSQGLESRVKAAKALVRLAVDSEIIGIAAIKKPLRAYRDDVFRKAKVPDSGDTFQLELGWVYVMPDHRGQGYSRILSAAALGQSEGEPTFATTRLENIAMQKTLEHLGFRRIGDPWRSERGRRPQLVLCVTS